MSVIYHDQGYAPWSLNSDWPLISYAGEKWSMIAGDAPIHVTEPLYSDLNNPHGFIVDPEMTTVPGIGTLHPVTITFPDHPISYFPDTGTGSLSDPIRRGTFHLRHHFSTAYFGGGFYYRKFESPNYNGRTRTFETYPETDLEADVEFFYQRLTLALTDPLSSYEGMPGDGPVYVVNVKIEWGDGEITNHVPDGGSQILSDFGYIFRKNGITAQHVYRESGDYTLKFTLTDSLGRQTIYNDTPFTIIVTEGASPLFGSFVDPPTGTLVTATNAGNDVRLLEFKRKSNASRALAVIANAKNPSIFQDETGRITLGYTSRSDDHFKTLHSYDGGESFH